MEVPEEVQEEEDKAPKQGFWSRVSKGLSFKSKKKEEPEEEDLLDDPDDLPSVSVDFSTPNTLSLMADNDHHQSIVVSEDGTVHRATVRDSGVKKTTEKRTPATRASGEESSEEASISDEPWIEVEAPEVEAPEVEAPKGKRYKTIEISTEEDILDEEDEPRTRNKYEDTAEHYFELLSKDITGEV
mgnify:CR=1 FL=1